MGRAALPATLIALALTAATGLAQSPSAVVGPSESVGGHGLGYWAVAGIRWRLAHHYSPDDGDVQCLTDLGGTLRWLPSFISPQRVPRGVELRLRGARPGDLTFARVVVNMLIERRARWEPQLEIEGVGRAAFVLVANGDPYSYAGAVPLHVAPSARFEGGFDFVAPTRVRARDVPRLIRFIVRGQGQLEADDILSGHDLDRLEVRCDRPLPLQADGEDLGDVESVVFEARRDAISVLV